MLTVPFHSVSPSDAHDAAAAACVAGWWRSIAADRGAGLSEDGLLGDHCFRPCRRALDGSLSRSLGARIVRPPSTETPATPAACDTTLTRSAPKSLLTAMAAYETVTDTSGHGLSTIKYSTPSIPSGYIDTPPSFPPSLPQR